MRVTAILLLFLSGLCRAQVLPAHPRLLFNADGIARLKARTQD